MNVGVLGKLCLLCVYGFKKKYKSAAIVGGLKFFSDSPNSLLRNSLIFSYCFSGILSAWFRFRLCSEALYQLLLCPE